MLIYTYAGLPMDLREVAYLEVVPVLETSDWGCFAVDRADNGTLLAQSSSREEMHEHLKSIVEASYDTPAPTLH